MWWKGIILCCLAKICWWLWFDDYDTTLFHGVEKDTIWPDPVVNVRFFSWAMTSYLRCLTPINESLRFLHIVMKSNKTMTGTYISYTADFIFCYILHQLSTLAQLIFGLANFLLEGTCRLEEFFLFWFYWELEDVGNILSFTYARCQ